MARRPSSNQALCFSFILRGRVGGIGSPPSKGKLARHLRTLCSSVTRFDAGARFTISDGSMDLRWSWIGGPPNRKQSPKAVVLG